ncbi:hypothetical protein D3C83_159640 [compost metagenome]
MSLRRVDQEGMTEINVARSAGRERDWIVPIGVEALRHLEVGEAGFARGREQSR